MPSKLGPIFVLLFIFQSFILGGQERDMSLVDISLLTCGSGDELYSTFGHSALRVYDQNTGRDVVFNYGTFNFEEPGFLLKFMRGKLPYYLSVKRYINFLRDYQYEERTVIEQKLLLNDIEKQRILTALEENLKPENLYYAYDFFFDNCSTRLQDLIDKSAPDYMIWPKEVNQLTFREMLHEDLKGMPWSEFGIDLVIGAIADRNPTAREEVFLPRYLMNQFDKAGLGYISGRQNLVEKTTTVIDFNDLDKIRSTRPFFTPHTVLWPLFFILLLIGIGRLGLSPNVIHQIFKWLAIVLGIASFISIFLWFFTDHQATKINWNLIWLNPLYVLVPLLKGRGKQWMVCFIGLGLLIACVNTVIQFLPQYFSPFNYGLYSIAALVLWKFYVNKNTLSA